MKQLIVAIFMVSFVVAAELHKGQEPNAKQVQHNQVQAGPVGVLAEIKNALRQPKTLALLASIGALHLASSYGEWCPEAVFMMGLAKYVGLASVCRRHLPNDVCILGSLGILAGVFWYQYSTIFWGIQEWIIERSGKKDRSIWANLGVASAERTLIYWGWKKP